MSNPPNEPPRFVVCPCQHCDGGIEFDASRAGETVACPSCGAETILFAPPISEHEENPSPVPPTAEEIKQAEIEKFKIQVINHAKSLMRNRLDIGKPVFLYDSVFVPVDSEILDKKFADGFDVAILRKLGLLGWDVVQAVPKTKGIGLENVGTQTTIFGSMWAGGVGGNVMGVHVIIKKTISVSDITDDPADEVGEFIRNHIRDFVRE
jgi:hypothetical protein